MLFTKTEAILERTMATQAFKQQAHLTGEDARLYTILLFGRGAVVPWVKLLDANSDEEAIDVARSMSCFTKRELWDRHRLVAEFPPEN